ncbi:MAG: hypothetical protein UHN47_03885 [Lachnospiraceae bacterium]|nr:hypothetical protein [Lachnospiraceae bacterium]
MPGPLRDVLKIAIVLIPTLIIGSLVFLGTDKGQEFAGKIFGRMDSYSVILDESDYTKYEGALVSGSDVIAAIKYFDNSNEPICVEIAHTGICYVYTDETLQTESTANIANASRKNSPEYINPNAKYLGSLVRDTTDNSIRKLVFTIQP